MNQRKIENTPLDNLKQWLKKKVKIFMIDNSSFEGYLKSVDENLSKLKIPNND